MTPIQIILMIVRGIATLTHNPALGGGGVGSQRTSALLDMFATLVEGGEATWEDMKAFAVEIQALVDAHGEPSRGQWDAMIARDMAARQKLLENLAALEANSNQQLSNVTNSAAGSAAPNLSLIVPVDPPL